jgi:hypothetical protein
MSPLKVNLESAELLSVAVFFLMSVKLIDNDRSTGSRTILDLPNDTFPNDAFPNDTLRTTISRDLS